MKKILLLSEIFPPVKGGSGRWFWEVYTRIQNGDVVVLAGENDSAASFDANSSLKTRRIPLSSVSWGLKSIVGFLFYWRTYMAIRKFVKQEHVEVIHCGRCIPEGFIGFLLKKTMGIPYICYIHGEDVETAATSRELSFIVRVALGAADYLVCNCKNTASIVMESWGASAEKTKVINPGVDATRFVPAPYNSRVKKALGWGERPVVLTVGRLQKRKGHDVMIEALAEVKARIPNVLYAIIGEGGQRKELEELVEQLALSENVQFMSEVSDNQMIEAYQQCDLFVLPNRSVGRDIEGFGMVLVEAQSCGKPVIAGDSGGTVETMVVGETGYIVDCTKPDFLAKAVVSILENTDEAAGMGEKGRQHVNASLDWENLSKQAEKLFDTV